MSELQPWRDGATDGSDAREKRASEVVRRASEIEARPMDVASGWDGVLAKATRPRTSKRVLLFAGATAMLVGVLGTASFLRAREPELVVATNTQWERRDDGAVQLQQGRLQTQRPVTLRIESPQVTVLARECRFAAEVLSEGTRVTVYEGTAVVRSGEGVERTLAKGESGFWPATPVIPSGLTPEPAAFGPTPSEPSVNDGGLTAEVSLFELGRAQAASGKSAAAIETWRSSLARFPNGVFEPEIRLSMLVALTREKRFAEALVEAKNFEETQPEDPRVEEVRALRKQLLWLTTKR
ncbi:MAG: hypothetical protein QM817_33620 [Archangium sp.]